MKYLYGYLAIGALVALFLYIYQRSTKPKDERKAEWFTLFLVPPIWPLALALLFCEVRIKERPPRTLFRDELAFEIETGELERVVTIEEVEQYELVDDPLNAAPRLPFGHLNHLWERFKAVIEPGMELHAFSAHYRGWFGHTECTKRGYVIVIDGVPGRYHLTEISSRPSPEEQHEQTQFH